MNVSTKVILIISLLLLSQNNFDINLLEAQVDILAKINALPDVEAIEIETQDGFERTFQIDIVQPVDHYNPSGQKFTQRIYLNHNDESLPMVLLTSGYSVTERSVQEIARIYKTNHMGVTRRYMNGSIPSPVDWQYLTIEQSAADHHKIVTLFKQIYPGAWISSGRSLSGLTALCHRRFHPDDVVGVLTYSSPLMFSTTDPRFDQFLNEVGTYYERNRIKQFQRTILIKRNEVLPLFTQYLINLGLGYSLGAEFILEFIVLEYPFYFWSYGDGDVSAIPDSTAPAAELLDALLNVVDGFEYTDYGNDYFKSVYYQLYTELGYYRLITEHLEDLLVVLTNPSHIIFAPTYPNIIFNPNSMLNLNSWLQSNGNNIIYLYGNQDPWSAAAVELTNQTNSVKFVQPGQNHFLRIGDLTDSLIVFSLIEEWFAASGIQNRLEISSAYSLLQNYPNPFNPCTSFRYSIPNQSKVTIKIYDILGNEIETLLDEDKIAGTYEINWSAKQLPSGVYFYRLQAIDPSTGSGQSFVETKKMLLMK